MSPADYEIRGNLLALFRQYLDGLPTDTDPDSWYPLALVIDKLGPLTPEHQETIGYDIISLMGLPVANNLADAFRVLDSTYHMNHRKNGSSVLGAGNFSYVDVKGRNEAVVYTPLLYPKAYNAGLLTRWAKTHAPNVTISDPWMFKDMTVAYQLFW